MVKKRKEKAKSPPSQLLDATARRSDVSGPATPASDQKEDSVDHTPVKTSPELARQVETLDALLASQQTELEESTPFNNASFESNDDLEDELNQLALSEAQLRRELDLFQGGAFFSDDEEEQQQAGDEYVFSGLGDDIYSPQASSPPNRPTAPRSQTRLQPLLDENEKRPAAPRSRRKLLSLLDDEESLDESFEEESTESSARSLPVGHSAEPAGAGSSEPPLIQETQSKSEIFRSSPKVSVRKPPPSSTSSPTASRISAPSPGRLDPSTPSPRRLDPSVYSGDPPFMSTQSPIREEIDYSMEVGDSLDSLFYSPTPTQQQARGELSPPDYQPPMSQKGDPPAKRESLGELEPPIPQLTPPPPQSRRQPDGSVLSQSPQGIPFGVSLLAKTPSQSKPQPLSRSEGSISSKESEGTPLEVSTLAAGDWGAPSLLEDVQQQTATAEPQEYRRQDAAAELDQFLNMDTAESSGEESNAPLLGREVGVHSGADEYTETIPTDYSNVSSIMSFSQDSAPVDEAPVSVTQVGEPFLVDTHDDSYRQDSDQAALLVGATPGKAVGELDAMFDQESLETSSSDSGDNVRRKKAALLFVIILLSILVVLVPISVAVRRNGTTPPLETVAPTAAPSRSPTIVPSSQAVTFAPSQLPAGPTFTPSVARTASPTFRPTMLPTMSPTFSPSVGPTTNPSSIPTQIPTLSPSILPTARPSLAPTASPISIPTRIPTSSPSILPTPRPSLAPTAGPTAGPTSLAPTAGPTTPAPTAASTTLAPTANPTTLAPITGPTTSPLSIPTQIPTSSPSILQTAGPSLAPTAGPSAGRTFVPSPSPVSDPTIAPSERITLSPTPFGEQRLFQFLLSVALDGGASLRDPTSPQFTAFEWLAANEDLASYSEDRIIQRYVLATFYFSTGGEQWLQNSFWVSDEDECTWYTRASSSCGEAGDFQRLELYFNNVQGSIPFDIGLLSNSLQVIDISGGPERAISGTLPTELGLVTRLQDFRVQNNNLTGILPSSYGAWTSLEWLDLSSNRLTATLPSEIGQWASIETLNIAKNQFQGTIPTEIGAIRSAIRLTLDDNMLQGSIPAELGLLTSLEILSAANNRLTMSIPSEIGLLPRLQFLSLHGNQLDGTLFTEIGRLTSLRALSVAGNSLSGLIPSQLGELMMLRDRLDLSNNRFSGRIPGELGRINNRLRRLFMQGNLLSGTVPSEFEGLTSLSLLRLESNVLTGAMPNEVCTLFNRTQPSVFIDCEEVFCPCCNFCCKEGEECVCRYLGTELEYLCFF
jgi:Leucine-rich repeat (LRR) protein